MSAKPGPTAIRLRSSEDENRQPWIVRRSRDGYLNLGDEVWYDLGRARYPSISWSLFDTLDYTARPSQFLHRSTRDFHCVAAQAPRSDGCPASIAELRAQNHPPAGSPHGYRSRHVRRRTFINRNERALRAYTQLRRRIGHPVPTFGTGVALSDFWKGREKIWTDRRKEGLAALAELPVVEVRGPLSKAQLDDAGAHNVVVSAHPAVALHASYATRSKREQDPRPLRVGINAGDCQGRLFGHQEGFEDALASAARGLRKSRRHAEIIPVWVKDVEACNDVARRAELDRSLVSPVCYSQAAFLRRVERLDLLVSLKLHAGILAAVANVPFGSLEYRSKCRDFAFSLGWEEFLVRTDQLDKDAVIERISALISQLDDKRTGLCRRVCRLMNRFENNCWTIEPLLLEPVLDLRFASHPPDPVG